MLLYVEHDDADTPKETKTKKIAAVLLTDDECVDSDIEDWVVVSRREVVNIAMSARTFSNPGVGYTKFGERSIKDERM